jgi:hypothetical protein
VRVINRCRGHATVDLAGGIKRCLVGVSRWIDEASCAEKARIVTVMCVAFTRIDLEG